MPQVITYILGGSLYINMTNRCTCDCDFCERNNSDSVGDAESLWLDYEPSREEILESINSRDLTQFTELVFCGFGEPMLRAKDLLWVARQIKQISPLPVRINTNGHGNIIAGYDITPEMSGIIDRLSISLNRADAVKYNKHIRPVFGSGAFEQMLDFVKKAKNFVPEITLTVLDLLSQEEITSCREIAENLGVGFRVRATH